MAVRQGFGDEHRACRKLPAKLAVQEMCLHDRERAPAGNAQIP